MESVWTLILFCCVSFVPSDTLKKTLGAFIYKHMTEGDPDTPQSSNVKPLADFSWKSLRRTYLNGTRSMVPSTTEMSAVKV